MCVPILIVRPKYYLLYIKCYPLLIIINVLNEFRSKNLDESIRSTEPVPSSSKKDKKNKSKKAGKTDKKLASIITLASKAKDNGEY